MPEDKKLSADFKITIGNMSEKSRHQQLERYRKRPLLERVSMMTDEEMADASIKSANKKAENSKAACVLKNGPSLFVAATTIASGVLCRGKLSDKTVAAAKTLGAGALVFGLAKPVSNAVGNIMDTVSKPNDFSDKKESEKHPLIHTVASAAALAATSFGVIAGAGAAKNKVAQKFQPAAQEISKNIAKKAQKLNSSFAGKITDKITESSKQFEKFHPHLSKALNTTVGAIPAVSYIAGSITLSNKINEQKEKDAASNFNKLSLAREFANEILSLDEN